jgi:hypothetical protein
MNLIQFHERLSSTSEQKINNSSEDAVIFGLLNGSFRIEDIQNITINEQKEYCVIFSSEYLAKFAEDKFAMQVIPGIYNRPLYGIHVQRDSNSLAIGLIEL